MKQPVERRRPCRLAAVPALAMTGLVAAGADGLARRSPEHTMARAGSARRA